MPLFRGLGGAVFDIASPDPALLESGALVPVEPEPAPTAPKPARKPRASKLITPEEGRTDG